MNNDPIFTVGQLVIARSIGGYTNHLTEGKTYKVLKYEPSEYDPVFTWPAFVTVKGDLGVNIVCHAYRMIPKG